MDKVTCTNCGTVNSASNKYCTNCGYTLPKPDPEVVAENAQQSAPGKEIKKKNWLSTIVGVAAFLLAYWAVQHFFFGAPTLDTQLNAVASELNKSCPMMIDKETRFDNAVAMPGKVFQYNYTLVNMQKGAVDTVAIKNYIRPIATSNAKTNPEMKYMRENNIILVYYYKDKNSDYLFSFAVMPGEYANQ